MTIELRTMWGSHTYPTTYLSSTKGVKAHYTGGVVNPLTLTDHSRCRIQMQAYEQQHKNQGWNGLGYSMWVCNHTAALARGPHALPAANGPGLNAGHYAILFLVGTSGVVTPTDAMKRNFHEARDYLIEHGNAGTEIKLHRDGYATSCPGDPIATWVRAGATLPGGKQPSPRPTPEPGDNDVEYSSFGLNEEDAYPIPANTWTDVKFREEFADPDNDHVAGLNSSILKGDPSIYALEVGLTLDGASGSLVEIQTVEVKYSAGPPAVDNVVEVGDRSTSLLTSDEVAHHAAVGSVQEGRKLRVQVRHFSPPDVPVTLRRARARVMFQK